MSKGKPSSPKPDVSKPLAYKGQEVVGVAESMLKDIVRDKKQLQKVLKVIEDAYMAGAYYAVDIALYGLEIDDGESEVVDYAITVLADESQAASSIVATLKGDEDEPDEDPEDDGGGGGTHTRPPPNMYH